MYNLDDDIADFNLQDEELTPFRNLKVWRERWRDDLELQKISQRSIKSYMLAIEPLLSFSKRHRTMKIDKIGAKYINRYLLDYQIKIAQKSNRVTPQEIDILLSEMKQGKIGTNDANFTVLEQFENTLSHRLTVAKMLLKYVTENNKEQHDYTRYFDKFAKIKVRDKDTDHLTPKELKVVLSFMRMWSKEYKKHKIKGDERSAMRDSFMLTLYALTGARTEEVVYIKLEDVSLSEDGKHYNIILKKTKGDKRRVVKVEISKLAYFVEYFTNLLPNGTYYLSSTWRSGSYTNIPVHPNTIRKFANSILSILQYDKSGLHAFRRGYVTSRIVIDDIDATVVAKEVGNTSAVLEKHYLKHCVV